MALELERDGAQLYSGALNSNDLDQLQRLQPAQTRPGTRIFGNPQFAAWLQDGPVSAIAQEILDKAARPVRAIFFDKTPETNWALDWHQDRTIAVRERIETSDFRHWNRKAGEVHVEPPFDVIERMITVRLHLDAVPKDNAPLLVAPGSHRMGRVTEDAIEDVVQRCGSFACVADPGNVWLYRTSILHASDRAQMADRRRVVQVDYSSEDLPNGLKWLGVA